MVPGTTLRLRGTAWRRPLRPIVSDGRCPIGATCVRAGEVVVGLTLRTRDDRIPFVLSDRATKATAGPCDVTLLTVTPHPRLGDPPRTGDYRVTIWVYSNDGH